MTGEKMDKIFPRSPVGQSMRWSKFKNNDPRDIYDVISQRVFPAIKNMKYGHLPDFTEQGDLIEVADDSGSDEQNTTAFARSMSNAMFLIPTPQVLQKIITGLDDLYEHDIADLDMQGDLYEYMLGKLATAGQNGQFRTPKHIREMMVELLQPTPDDTICDPACGTAGFLVSASEYIRRHYEDTMTSEQWEHFAGGAFTGFDTDRTMLRISAMNLMLHSISHPDSDYKDSVSKQNQISDKFTICLANPPFKGTVDAESIHDNLKTVTNTKKTELLFLALFLRMLKKGGQCACIVPDGVLFDSSKAHKAIRKELVENHQLRAVISLHALRRVQALCGRFHSGAGVHQDRRGRHRKRVVLRYESRRLFAERQAQRGAGKQHSRHHRAVPPSGAGNRPPTHRAELLCAETGNCGQ